MTPLRIGLDARFVPGERGGVEQATLGLARGLSQLRDGDEEYHFLIYAGAEDWLRPYLGGACRALPGPAAPDVLRRAAPRPVYWFARWLLHHVSPVLGARSVPLPHSDSTIERAQIDLMHFTTQTGFLTEIPSIYQPWDLQHVHLPQFFTPRERLARDITYRVYCARAALVVVPSRWGKSDLVAHYNLPANKIAVIPAAPALTLVPPNASDLDAVRRKYALPERFVFYPAQTWAHKNHLGLLAAMARLGVERQREITLICTGTLNDFSPVVQRRVQELRLDQQVRFLGYVTPHEVRCLYQLCCGLVFPTKFEGFGLPLLEAFNLEVPVACSDVTCLPEIASDAALLFDPDQPAAIADALDRLWTDEALRQDLIRRGRLVAAHYSWLKTARLFRAHYRRLAYRHLTNEDRELLAATDFDLSEAS